MSSPLIKKDSLFVKTSILSLAFALFFLHSCQSNTSTSKVAYYTFTGETMGTSYVVKVKTNHTNLKPRIDSLLDNFSTIFSTYENNSLISYLNRSTDTITCITDKQQLFYNMLELSREIYESTSGFFDPTVMPLVSFWGFGPQKKSIDSINTAELVTILDQIGFDQIDFQYQNEKLCIDKNGKHILIDLNAIAKGGGVDLLAKFLNQMGSENYMVEIGGEVLVKGKNAIGENWLVGIDNPLTADNQNIKRQGTAIVILENQAIASSGNYRDFKLLGDSIIGHTINPITGYPEINDILGVSVIADNCAKADAYATAFMAMGYERTKKVVANQSDLKVFLIKLDEVNKQLETISLNGFEEKIVSQN